MKYSSAQTRKRSLSTPQRLLRRTLRRSLDLAQLRSLPAISSSPVSAIARDYPSVRLFDGGGSMRSMGGANPSSSSEVSTSAVNMATTENVRVPDTSQSASVTASTPIVVANRNSQEPLRKKQRKVSANMEPLDTADLNVVNTPKPASRSQSPSITRSTRGRSTTPRRSSRGQTPSTKLDPFVSNGTSSEFPPRSSSKTPIAVAKFSTSTKVDIPQLTKTQETTIQVERIPYEDAEEEEDEDYRDFMPENLPSGSPAMRNRNGTASSRLSARSVKQPEPFNKVKTGRVSKFKEGSMNDRASTRPPPELIGYAYANRNGVSQAVSEASQSTNTTTHNTKASKREKLTFLPRKYTGDEVFTFGGFITSVFQFRGIEYCKENFWGPRWQKVCDKIHGDLEKFKEDKELQMIKAKAEALYKLRKEKEWKEMEAKKKKATEELRRRKQERKERDTLVQQRKQLANGGGSVGIKRKFGDMAESFGEGEEDRVWDEAEKAVEKQLGEEVDDGDATDIDGDLGIGSDILSNSNEPLEVGADDIASSDDESELDEEELAEVEDLARIVTGKDIIAQVLPSRSPSVSTSLQASPSRRRKFIPADSIDLMIFSQECEVPQFNQYPASLEHSDQDSDHGCASFLVRGPNKGKTSTTPSDSGASSSGSGGGNATKSKSLHSALKSRASWVFGGSAKAGQSNGGVNTGSISSTGSMDIEAPEPKLTKKELQKQERLKLQKQERLKKKVMDLESKLLDTWKELEASGGVTGLGLNSVPSKNANVGRETKINGADSAIGDAMGPPPVPVGKGL